MNILQELESLNLTEDEILFTYKTSVFRNNRIVSAASLVSTLLYFKKSQIGHFPEERIILIQQELLEQAIRIREKNFEDLMKIKRQSGLQQQEYDEVKDEHSYGYIDSLNLTSEEIRENMKQSEFITYYSYSPLVNNLFFPKISTHFYWYIFKYKKIPMQQEFFDSFFLKYNDFFSLVVPEKDMPSLKARVYGGYSSIYQQIEHYHFLRESNLFDKVYFNLKADIEGKVDCFIKKNGQWFGLQMRLLSNFSNEMFEKKKRRNPVIYNKTTLIDTPINKKDGLYIRTNSGKSFFFYSKLQLDQTLKSIEVLQKQIK